MLKSSLTSQPNGTRKGFLAFFRSLLITGVISVLVWGAISFFFGWQMSHTLSLSTSDVLGIALRDSLIWGFATCVIFIATQRFPIERDRWKISLPIHLAICLVFLLGVGWLGESFVFTHHRSHPIEGGLRKGSYEWAERSLKPPKSLLGGLFAGPHLPIYLIVLSIAHTLHFYRRAREREIRASELATRLAEARLQALRMQIQPHFLFNSLNALATLMHKNVPAAEEMLTTLSDFLRLTLDGPAEQEVPLHRELEYVEHYLKLEKIRFGDRLVTHIKTAPDTLAAHVPTLILQPLIENAVRHGIESKAEPGTISILSWRQEGVLYLAVRDNGIGVTMPPTEGIGLANIRARLAELYGDQASMTLYSGGGTEVKIRLPLHFS